MKSLQESLLDDEDDLLNGTDALNNGFPGPKDIFKEKIYISSTNRLCNVEGYYWPNNVFNIIDKNYTGIYIFWRKEPYYNHNCYRINVFLEENHIPIYNDTVGYVPITNNPTPSKVEAKKIAYEFLTYLKNNTSKLPEIYANAKKRYTGPRTIMHIEDIIK